MSNQKEKCPVCKGKKFIRRFGVLQVCEYCDGTGSIIRIDEDQENDIDSAPTCKIFLYGSLKPTSKRIENDIDWWERTVKICFGTIKNTIGYIERISA